MHKKWLDWPEINQIITNQLVRAIGILKLSIDGSFLLIRNFSKAHLTWNCNQRWPSARSTWPNSHVTHIRNYAANAVCVAFISAYAITPCSEVPWLLPLLSLAPFTRLSPQKEIISTKSILIYTRALYAAQYVHILFGALLPRTFQHSP